MSRNNSNLSGLVAAALVSILGRQSMSPEEMYFEAKEFKEDPQTADAYSKMMTQLNKIDPKDVDCFTISVVARNPRGEKPEPCPGCGEFHDTLSLTGGISGSTTDLMALFTMTADASGLTS